jgi:hypothetical protein
MGYREDFKNGAGNETGLKNKFKDKLLDEYGGLGQRPDDNITKLRLIGRISYMSCAIILLSCGRRRCAIMS